MTLTPNTDAGLAFLRDYEPAGPWVLTAILKPDAGKPRIETRSFAAEDHGALADWVRRANSAGWNVYFMVNRAKRPLTKKATKDDVKECAWLHVDIDPRPGEEIAAERDRALRVLKAHDPAPTCIIDSGGGYQGFWRLREPIGIDDAEARNRALEEALGGDSCHNADRIMRLPGTVNWPDAKKRKKGRVPAIAAQVEFNKDRIYGADQFKEVAPVLSANSEPVAVSVGNAIPRIESVRDLPAAVPDRIKKIIEHGPDPEHPKSGDNTRSAWLFDAVCGLVRAGVDDGTILATITEPSFRISESVLEKPNPRRYALRQIHEARLKAGDDPISEINRSYFAALEGGKLRFFREEPDDGLADMDKQAFVFELSDRRMKVEEADGKAKEVPAVNLWMQSPRRRYFRRGFVLDPTYGEDQHQYNLWKGFAVDPAPGDWSLMQAHIKNVLASGNEAHADYIKRWTAWAFQNPATPPRVALVFRGKEGVGKGVFADSVRRAFGIHGMRIQNMMHMTGRFNAHLRHLCLLFADEAVAPNDREGEGALKGLITETTIPIEKKGVDVVQADNHLHVIMASNAEWVVPAGIEARRFAMFDVADDRRGDRDYFSALFGQMQNGGLAAMLHDLLALDLRGFDPETKRPETAALNAQKERSLPPFERLWLDVLRRGELPTGHRLQNGAVRIPTRELAELARTQLRRDDVSANAISTLLGDKLRFEKVEKSRPRGWIIPALAEARARWDEVMFPVKWDAADEWDWPAQPF